MAARIPMIATTTSSSISLKPFDFFLFILATLLISSSPWVVGGVVMGAVSWPDQRASRVPRGHRACQAPHPCAGCTSSRTARPGRPVVPRHAVQRRSPRNDGGSFHHGAELEHRQVHRDHEAADDHDQETNDGGLE